MKIYPVSELVTIIAALRLDKKIIHCHGCWDLLHIGHVRHLQAAKKMGDILIVTVTGDAFVNKGDDRPIFPEDERAEMLEALACIDYIAINNNPDVSQAILLLSPHFYVKGVDYIKPHPKTTEEISVEAIGGKIMFTTTEKHSSTDLIERYLR